MGIVKFNNQSLQIDQVPDGHIIVTEQELSSLKAVNNDFLRLKSFIPPTVNVAELGQIVEKGQRYDGVATQLTDLQTQLKTKDAELAKFANMPKEFTPEKWNSYVQTEQKQIRGQKIATVTAKAYEKIKTDMLKGAEPPKVDPRFIPNDALEAINPDDPGAVDAMVKILDNAHTEQQKFLETIMTQTPPPASPMGQTPGAPAGGFYPAPNVTGPQGVPNPISRDIVSDNKLSVGGLGQR